MFGIRPIKAFSTFFLVAGLTLGFSQGLGPVLGNEAAPSWELDKKGQRSKFNFNTPIKAISDPGLKFSQFTGRKTLVFYFSAKCPHCQQAAPHVQRLGDELASKGYQTVAIAIKYNTDEDIRGFSREFKIHMPIFQDDTRTFGETYGVGTIPLLFLINEKGEYIRYKSFDDKVTPGQIRSVAMVNTAK